MQTINHPATTGKHDAPTRENERLREQLAACRAETDRLRNQLARTHEILQNSTLDPAERITGVLTLEAFDAEFAESGITPADGYVPIPTTVLARVCGLSKETVSASMTTLENAGAFSSRLSKPQKQFRDVGGKRVPYWKQETERALPQGTTEDTRYFLARVCCERTHGGLHGRTPERIKGKFAKICPACGAHDSLKAQKRVIVVCNECGTVIEEAAAHDHLAQTSQTLAESQVAARPNIIPDSKVTSRGIDPNLNGKNRGKGAESQVAARPNILPDSKVTRQESPPNLNGKNRPKSDDAPSTGESAPVAPAERQLAAVNVGTTSRILTSGPTFAVLDAGITHICQSGVVKSSPRESTDRPTLAHILHHATLAGLEELWFTPAWCDWRGLPARTELTTHPHSFISAAESDGWTFQPPGLARWISARRPRDGGGYDSVRLSFPAYDRETRFGTADGRTLVDALLYLEGATEQHYLGHPLKTSQRILKISNRWKPLTPLALPEVAHDARLEWELAHMDPRGLEEVDGQFVHCYDRNGAYLAVCGALPVGEGELRHRGESTGGASANVPGYWRCRIRLPSKPAFFSFDPFHDAHHPPGEFHWRTSPTIKFAREMGADIDYAESWTWAEKRRPLERWAEVLREARYGLADVERYPNREAADIAGSVVKSYYTRLMGRFAAHLPHQPDDEIFYRPDIRHAILAAARAQMARTIVQLSAARISVVLAHTDAVYVLSTNPDPVAFCPSALELSPQLGKWKAAGTWTAREFCAPMWEEGATAQRVLRAIQGQ